ncbi:putative calpain-1 catalytic subunit [Diaporthe ampelina]|uniref:Putative calpain-1 catalytic subunit n=1 Tax=Diaporthe ampelina TaxID=1214573 RepID=A0A0G2H2G4_9PEZI|nr:putative calpain-1 catalytic subunit [Diaporthe ampelina]
MDDAPYNGGRQAARTPQGDVNSFWARFSRKRPSKVTSIFPRLLYASLLPRHPDPRGASSARNAAESYDFAARECRDKVRRIREECERTNEKFTDPDFDIESDFDNDDNCLFGLRQPRSHHHASLPPLRPPPDDRSVTTITRNAPIDPGSVHRLDWVFRNPQFTVNGYSHTDVQQGIGADCWWLAAISTIAHRKDLMDRICVARDEECGVYGFVFQRDGEWISTVVDDNLYLSSEDFRERNPEVFDPDGSKAAKFRSLNQRGSDALFFSRCTEENETWLPLLEKAYAKAHGDYEAIDWGYVGDGVEDMTGGVTTSITTNKILRKDRLWKELTGSDGQFVFGLSAQFRSNRVEADSGVALGHAYTILRAVEVDTENGKGSVRLVKIRNPWGKRDIRGRIGEWNGRWSDGSEEWTPYWMEKLDHRFSNDGIFWMEYGDTLQTFRFIYRTRLFDEEWTVIQQWASCSVSWVTGYLRTKFILDVKKAGMVVIVMAQLDTRYFRGLEGQYEFSLHFVITAERNQKHTVESLVPQYARSNPQKLRQVGLQYDLAHAKGGM